MSEIIRYQEPEREMRAFEKVPGMWRCTGCRNWLSGEEQPECACGQGHVVALSWKLYGNEGYRQAQEATETLARMREGLEKQVKGLSQELTTASKLKTALQKRIDALHLLVAWLGVALGFALLALVLAVAAR